LSGRDPNDRWVLALFAAAAAALLLFTVNAWVLFGVVACAMLVLSLAVGFGAARPLPLVSALLAGLFAVYAVLVPLMAWVSRPDQPLQLFLGLPAGTALLVYAVWPIPLAAGLVYALVFRRELLTPEKLRQFLAGHGRR
jgi:hypothetical protein